MFIDSHCHLEFPDFGDELDDVVRRAGDAGIDWMVTIGTRLSAFDPVLAISERYDNVFCSVGIHPHNAGTELKITTEHLTRIAARYPKVIGFGETGLDYFYDHSPRDIQQEQFKTHIRAAREAGLPVIVHTRDADEDTLRILQESYAEGPFTGVIHCFSSGPEFAKAVLEMGLYISISGVVTFKRADALRETVADIPLDRLLVETDAPYLAPVPWRGRRNEPAYTAHTAAKVAEVKGVEPATLAEATTTNFFALFTKAAAWRDKHAKATS